MPPDLLGQIKAIHDVIGPHFDMTLEQFELGFMRDMRPEREVGATHPLTPFTVRHHGDGD